MPCTPLPSFDTPPLPAKKALPSRDVAARDAMLAALLAYHPFWLRLGLEVVTQRAVPPASDRRGAGLSAGSAGGAEAADGGGGGAGGEAERLRAFALAHFLGDAELEAERAAARGAAHFDEAAHYVSARWGDVDGWREGFLFCWAF